MARAVMERVIEAEFLDDEPTGYAHGFLQWAFDRLGVTDPDKVLHLFSGGVKRGVTVDLRPETNPTVCCDAAHTPLDEASFQWIMADPPPNDLFNSVLYGLPSRLPSEQELLKEVKRLLVPGGVLGILQPTVPEDIPGLKLEKTYAVITGPSRFVCGWHVMRRVQ